MLKMLTFGMNFVVRPWRNLLALLKRRLKICATVMKRISFYP